MRVPAPFLWAGGTFAVLALAVTLAGARSAAAPDPLPAGGTERTPVVVELFTSEGCSSCPPADEVMTKLVSQQPVAGAEIIGIGEHVDYWNRLGWRDPFSSATFSARQSEYASRVFHTADIYTPQMVVDGTTEFVGNNSRLATQAVQKALVQQKVPVRLSNISLESSKVLRAHVETGALPEASKATKADVYLVIALNHAESQVLRGENSGRKLTHVGVVQSLTKIGSLEPGKGFAQDVQVRVDSKSDPTNLDMTNLRVIAFVQQAGQRQVLGAAQEKMGR